MEKQIAKHEEEIDLLELAMAVWSKAVMIVLISILIGALALSYTLFFVTPMYEASTLMYVNNSSINVGSTSVRISSGELSAAQSLIDTYGVILKSRTTLEAVRAESGVDYTYKELVEMISSKAVNKTEIFEVTVTSADPAEAKVIANTIAKVLPQKISDIVDNSSVRIVDYAVTPTQRVSPSYSKTLIMGLFAGFVLGCAIAILEYFIDDVIHSEDYLRDTYEVPVLAAVPDLYTDMSGKYGYAYGAKSKKEDK